MIHSAPHQPPDATRERAAGILPAVLVSLLGHAALLLLLTAPMPRAPEPPPRITVVLQPPPAPVDIKPPAHAESPPEADAPPESMDNTEPAAETRPETPAIRQPEHIAEDMPVTRVMDAAALRSQVLDEVRATQSPVPRSDPPPTLGASVPALPSTATYFSPLMPGRGSGESLVWREADGQTLRSRTVLSDGTVICGRTELPGLFERFHAAVFQHTICGRERPAGPDPDNPWTRPLGPD